jgi:xylulokinase
VNTFVHVNHARSRPRYGVLLCINGAGILNSWVKRQVMQELDYEAMNRLAAEAPVGSEGLVLLPYGNGAERTLGNRDIGSAVRGLNFNVHERRHVARAAQEAVVFALNYGLDIMRGVGVEAGTVRAGHANMFLSPVFTEAFATVTGARVELTNTDGSQGAARGAGVGAGITGSLDEAFEGLQVIRTVEPNADLEAAYRDAYGRWVEVLEQVLGAAR